MSIPSICVVGNGRGRGHTRGRRRLDREKRDGRRSIVTAMATRIIRVTGTGTGTDRGCPPWGSRRRGGCRMRFPRGVGTGGPGMDTDTRTDLVGTGWRPCMRRRWDWDMRRRLGLGMGTLGSTALGRGSMGASRLHMGIRRVRRPFLARSALHMVVRSVVLVGLCVVRRQRGREWHGWGGGVGVAGGGRDRGQADAQQAGKDGQDAEQLCVHVPVFACTLTPSLIALNKRK